jgi:hypothetical protein
MGASFAIPVRAHTEVDDKFWNEEGPHWPLLLFLNAACAGFLDAGRRHVSANSKKEMLRNAGLLPIGCTQRRSFLDMKPHPFGYEAERTDRRASSSGPLRRKPPAGLRNALWYLKPPEMALKPFQL